MAKAKKQHHKHHEGDENRLVGHYEVQIHGPDGELLHEEKFHNLVVNQGKNAMLDKFLGLGAAYAGIYLSLITTSTAPAATNTYASPGNTEIPAASVSGGLRLAPTYGAASNGSKATSSGTVFTLTAGATITGMIQVLGPTSGTSTIGDTATAGAILYSHGLFSSSITVPSGSTITVNYTGSL